MTENPQVTITRLRVQAEETAVYVARLEDNQAQHLRTIDRLRHDVDVACERADVHRCNWERAEAECETLRAWKDAVPLAAIWHWWNDDDLPAMADDDIGAITSWLAALDGAA